MNWLQLCKKMGGTSTQELPLAPFELEHLLDAQILQGDVFAVLRTLRLLGRRFFQEERVELIDRCMKKKTFAYAFYLTRPLPEDDRKKALLAKISRGAAFADDFGTARAAALLSEQIHS